MLSLYYPKTEIDLLLGNAGAMRVYEKAYSYFRLIDFMLFSVNM